MVLDSFSNTHEFSEELSSDLLAITTVFVARLQGRRAAENRRKLQSSKTNPDQSGFGSDQTIEEGHGEIDVATRKESGETNQNAFEARKGLSMEGVSIHEIDASENVSHERGREEIEEMDGIFEEDI